MKAKIPSRKPKKSMVAPEPKFGLAELKSINEKAIADAGARYFPNIKSDIPDKNIAAFGTAMTGLVGGDKFRDLVRNIAREIQEQWQNASRETGSKYPNALPEPKLVLRALNVLVQSAPGRGSEGIVELRRSIVAAQKGAEALSKKIQRAQAKLKRENNSHISVADLTRPVDRYSGALRRAEEFLPQKYYPFGNENAAIFPNACGLHENGTLLLYGEWGMGKTHLLCDLAKKQQTRGLPALLVLAKDFDPGKSPGNALARHAGAIAPNFTELLRRLDTLGRNAGVRALLLVDGINEKNPNGAWSRMLGKMLKQVRCFPYVGMVVSYRTPFNHGLSRFALAKTPCMEHRGFEEISFKAQTDFLKYYGISLPEIPPMADEFTRPLTLRIICEAFCKLPKKDRRKGFDGIASGQKGMTFILEQYVKERAKDVPKEYSLKPSDFWQLIKCDIAPYMAKNLTEKMPAVFLLQSIRKQFSVDWLQARKILRYMAKNGVVTMTKVSRMHWIRHDPAESPVQSGKRRAIHMPYQKFSDHIIARSILNKHLRTKSAGAVRRSFYADRPLGEIFSLHKHGLPFFSARIIGGPELAEALIMEFPERIKNTPGITKLTKELLFNLPRWKKKYASYHGPFVSGLCWREKSTISDGTFDLINRYVCAWEYDVNRAFYNHGGKNIMDALLRLSCKHASPLSARCLYRYVKSMKMPDRDLLWETVTRQSRKGGWSGNLFTWLEHHEQEGFQNMSPDAARNYVVLLSLFLGTPDRPLRNRTTRTLVAIGEHFPAALFFHTLDTLDFNDIYYPERMLAASYGVAMSLRNNPKAKAFRPFCLKFPAFARAVVKDVFIPGGRLLTHHAVVRDYALGIAHIARELGVKFSKETEKHMVPPFSAVKSPFPSVSALGDAGNNGRLFHHDLENYTIGALFPDRRPYNFKHKKYAVALRQIKWRIKNLGYDEDRFMKWERQIGMYDHSAGVESGYGKVDHHQKKYLWIAYYEKYGLLSAHGKLPDLLDARVMDGVIDPSFPVAPREWDPKFKDIPMNVGDNVWWIVDGPAPDYRHILETNDLGGIPGPWVLMEGFVEHENKDKSRGLFSFLRGVFVQESDIARLTKILRTTAYPGNFQISDIPDRHRICAGEIPWVSSFIRGKSRNHGTAFREIPIETTALVYGWDENYNERNQKFNIFFPSPGICAKLHLSRSGRGVDLVDMNGRPASLYRADEATLRNAKEVKDEFRFLHLRKDLLDKYLRATGKRLVWIIWGERQIIHDWRKPQINPDSPEIQLAYQDYRHIHKRLIIYPQNK